MHNIGKLQTVDRRMVDESYGLCRNEQTTSLKEKSTENFMKNWKPIFDFLHDREK